MLQGGAEYDSPIFYLVLPSLIWKMWKELTPTVKSAICSFLSSDRSVIVSRSPFQSQYKRKQLLLSFVNWLKDVIKAQLLLSGQREKDSSYIKEHRHHLYLLRCSKRAFVSNFLFDRPYATKVLTDSNSVRRVKNRNQKHPRLQIKAGNILVDYPSSISWTNSL